MKLPGFLAEQVGPLPVGGWLLAVGGGLGAAALINRTRDGADDQADGGDTVAGIPNVVPLPAGTADDLRDLFGRPRDSDDTIDTLDEWADRAIRHLISLGYEPSFADVAVRQYVNALPLTSRQRAAINDALTHLGPAPGLTFPVDLPETPPGDPSTAARFDTDDDGYLDQVVVTDDPTEAVEIHTAARETAAQDFADRGYSSDVQRNVQGTQGERFSESKVIAAAEAAVGKALSAAERRRVLDAFAGAAAGTYSPSDDFIRLNIGNSLRTAGVR